MRESPRPMEFSNNIVLRNLRRKPLSLVGVPGVVIALVGFALGIAIMHPIHLYVDGWTWLFQGVMASWLVIIGLMLMLFAVLLSQQNWNK